MTISALVRSGDEVNDDDQEPHLITRSRGGDRQAFARLVTLHQGRVRAYIGCYLKWSDLVDDVAQEAFLAAFRSMGDYDGAAPFKLWLLGIARHRVLRHLRSDGRKRSFFEELLFEGRLERVAAEAERLTDRDRQVEQLRRCVERLPPGSAGVVRAHYVDGKSLAEIARDGGKKESAVRMMLMRVRQALRQCVEQRTAEGSA